MNLKQVTVATACIGLMLAACQKEKQPAISTGNTSSGQLKAASPISSFFANNQNNATQHFFVDPQVGAHLYGSQGTELIIPANALHDGNNVVLTEQVTVSLNEIYSLSNMVLSNIPTEALSGAAITTGGAFSVEFSTASATPVTFVVGTIHAIVPGANTGGVDAAMTIWKGGTSNIQAGDNAWTDQGTVPQIVGNTYDFPLPAQQWVNVDRFYTGDFAPWRVVMPQGFNPSNTEVFVAMNGIKNRLVSLDVYEAAAASGSWSEDIPYSAPGQQGNIIVVNIQNGQLRTKIQPFTVGANSTVQVSGLTANTVAGLQDQINSLP
jgi:hypothetical protein